MTKKSKKQLVSKEELETLSPFAREIADGLLDGLKTVQGKQSGARESVLEIPDPPPTYDPAHIRKLRQRLGMTQSVFARFMNVSVRSIEAWESGEKSPGPSSRRLLQIAQDGGALASIANAAGYDLVRKPGRKKKASRKRSVKV